VQLPAVPFANVKTFTVLQQPFFQNNLKYSTQHLQKVALGTLHFLETFCTTTPITYNV